MKIAGQLPDVNVLVALLWPRHKHHKAAQEWFAAEGHRGWATNSITQIGVMRLLTNPAITRGAVNASTALRTLAEASRHPNHEFWPMGQPAISMLSETASSITGHGQWTSLLLFRHAVERDGKLVTFDGGISSAAGKDAKAHLLVLKDRT